MWPFDRRQRRDTLGRLEKALGELERVDQDLSMVERTKLDGFANTLTNLGIRGKDKDESSTVLQLVLLTDSELMNLFRDNGIAAKIVEDLPKEATRRGWELSQEDQDLTSEDARVDLRGAVREACKWARLFRGAVVLMGFQDSVLKGGNLKGWAEPLDASTADELKFLRVYDARSVVVASYNEDAGTENFGEPEVYRINGTEFVHASRLLRFDGIELPRPEMQQHSGWGDSVLQRAWKPLRRYAATGGSMAQMVHEYNILVWKIRNLRGILSSDGGEDEFAARLAAVNLSKSTINAIAIDADGEEMVPVTREVAGLVDIYYAMQQEVAAVADMPVTRLFGSSPQGLSTDDKSGRENWFNHVASWWEDNVHGQLDQYYGDVAAMKGKEVKGEITLLPLQEPTDEEREDLKHKQAQRDKIHVSDMKTLTREEVREARFGEGSGGDVPLLGELPDPNDGMQKSLEQLTAQLTPLLTPTKEGNNGEAESADETADEPTPPDELVA